MINSLEPLHGRPLHWQNYYYVYLHSVHRYKRPTLGGRRGERPAIVSNTVVTGRAGRGGDTTAAPGRTATNNIRINRAIIGLTSVRGMKSHLCNRTLNLTLVACLKQTVDVFQVWAADS